MPAREKSVVLASGGLNSAVAASLAASEYDLAMLHVQIAHRAADKELALFSQQADFFEARYRQVVEMPHFSELGANARVNRKKPIEDVLAIAELDNNCYIPGMIGSLLNAAFAWAVELKATRIYIGISENLGPPGPRTGGVFPDYTREYVQLIQHAFSVASPQRDITIETPLIELTRTEIVKLGRRLHSPFELTWSCLSSGNEPCGGCLGCATRNRGFLEAAIGDPLLLQVAHH